MYTWMLSAGQLKLEPDEFLGHLLQLYGIFNKTYIPMSNVCWSKRTRSQSLDMEPDMSLTSVIARQHERPFLLGINTLPSISLAQIKTSICIYSV